MVGVVRPEKYCIILCLYGDRICNLCCCYFAVTEWTIEAVLGIYEDRSALPPLTGGLLALSIKIN